MYSQKITKEIEIGDHKIVALIDTGCDSTLIRTDEYVDLGLPPLKYRRIKFERLGSKGNETLDAFTTTIRLDGEDFSVRVYVTPGQIVKHAFILGADFSNRVKMVVEGGNIEYHKREPVEENDSNVPSIFKINVIDEQQEAE